MSSGTLAIMFTDIAGSTRLYEQLGDITAREHIAECLLRLGAVTLEQGGRVVKTIGDEALCTFPDVEAAVVAACGMQELFDGERREAGQRDEPGVSLRIGLHAGPVLVESSDVFGDAVNVAARMLAQAKVGQIITTRAVVAQLPPLLRGHTRLIDRAPLKGKRDSVELFEIMWQQDDVTRMSPDLLVEPTARGRLSLQLHDVTRHMDEAQPQLVLGRSKSADLTVQEPLASRLHARVEHRRGKFFLVDQSTNGTWLRGGGEEVFLRREEALLAGRGVISLGRPLAEQTGDLVHFEVIDERAGEDSGTAP